MAHSVELSQCTVTRGVYSQGNRERDRETDTEGMAGRYRSHQEQYPQWLDYA